jgi:hypothetical protein
MATPRKPAARSTTAPAPSVLPVKPSAKLAATPAGRKAAKTVKANTRPAKAATQAAAPKAAMGDNAGMGAKPAKGDKVKKPKLVRDSFTIPKVEYAVIDTLKQRGGKLGKPVKKSELLRAGLKALAALPDLAFVAALDAVPALKTGRPAKS